jgi:hypothetical protein
LILASEEGDLDLLALVLVRVVLDGSEASLMPHGYVVVPAVSAAKCAARVVPVWVSGPSISGENLRERVSRRLGVEWASTGRLSADQTAYLHDIRRRRERLADREKLEVGSATIRDGDLLERAVEQNVGPLGRRSS